jgi:hypothetical protein
LVCRNLHWGEGATEKGLQGSRHTIEAKASEPAITTKEWCQVAWRDLQRAQTGANYKVGKITRDDLQGGIPCCQIWNERDINIIGGLTKHGGEL